MLHLENPPPSATHLIPPNHGESALAAYETGRGACYFCGHEGAGLPAADVISEDYFSDHNLRSHPESEHVCAYCAYCMDHRGAKQGHWLASANTFRRVSTGDLRAEFNRLRDGEYDPPLAVHVSENPIRSEHAYLWTPVAMSTDPLVVSYATETATIEWDEFDDVLDAVEELRWHGFRGDDIRSGEPRVRNLESLGRARYRALDTQIEPHRGTPFLDIVWTVSRARDDQPNPPQSADA